ncbi:ABC transporter permease [Clostridium sp. JNZ X4-2]
MKHDRKKINLKKASRNLTSIIGFLAIWEVLPRIGIVDSALLPPFSEVVSSLYTIIFVKGILLEHIKISIIRSLEGLGLAIVVGISLGLFIGRFKVVEVYINPVLQLFRQTSALALFPVFIIFFGVGETSKVLIIFWGCVWPMLINTIDGVKSTPILLIKAAKSMGCSSLQILKKVILPAACPYIFTGLKLSASTSIIMLTAAEMLGANKGLGYFISYSQQTFQIPYVYATIAVISIIGLILTWIVTLLEKFIYFWKEEETTE